MFIERNEQGEIIAVYASEQPGRAEEFMPHDSQEITDFYQRLNEAQASE